MKRVAPWMLGAGILGALWWLSRPGGATRAATGAGTAAAGGLDAGRHHGHFRGLRGPVTPSWQFVGVDYVEPPCDPRVPCGQQPVLPCRCG